MCLWSFISYKHLFSDKHRRFFYKRLQWSYYKVGACSSTQPKGQIAAEKRFSRGGVKFLSVNYRNEY